MNILCVCLGNICRSPAAEGILRNLAIQKDLDIMVDSAGTGGWHIGDHPDRRSIEICKKHNIDITHLISRKVNEKDGKEFDLILCMDYSNIESTKAIIAPEFHHKIQLFDEREVGDPYYGMYDGFENMFLQLEKAAHCWLEKIKPDLV